MSNRFYNSWISLTVFIGLIIFVPYKASFFTFKVSDIWLLLCLGLEFVHGFNYRINFRNRGFIKNFGIIMGLTAVTATILQALYDHTIFDPVFFSHFFRLFRYFLIFKLVENFILNSPQKSLSKFLNSYTAIGAVVIAFSFLEFYSVGSFQRIIVALYYIAPDRTFGEYLEDMGRLSGVMGNSNATAIYITSTIVFPLFILTSGSSSGIKKILFILYSLFAVFVILVMTSSRTSIIISVLLIFFLFVLSFARFKNLERLFFIIVISSLLGIYFYSYYSSNIVISNRVVWTFEGKNTRGEKSGFLESMGRNQLWQERLTTFKNNSHPLAVLTGMGYTKEYKDYSDNGLLSSFLNLGLVGLVLRVILYYLVFKYCFVRLYRDYKKSHGNYLSLIFGLFSLVFILWEITAETIEHIKIGQLFYLFFCATFINNANYYRLKRKNSLSSLKSKSSDKSKENVPGGMLNIK